MTNEEFERIKEEEKAHLREIRKLRTMAKQLRAKRSVQAALERMLDGSREVLDTHDEMVRRLAVETARHEARLDLALEDTPPPPADARAADGDPLEDLDDALLKARARQLLERMTAAEAESTTDDASGAEPPQPPATDPPPTDPRAADQQGDEPPPRKTLGRSR